jgi:hypothetical protein
LLCRQPLLSRHRVFRHVSEQAVVPWQPFVYL